jgi:nucleoside-diphosphate-sugar epimerase
MKTLVLGGTGFVGRRLVEILIADGAGVTVLNRGVTPVEPPAGVIRVVADRSDATSMRAALARTEWDAVFDVSGVAKVAGGTDPADLADLLAGRVGRYVYVSDLARAAGRPLCSRLFTPAHHGMLDPGKITQVLGLSPVYDLRGGHAQTLEWFRRSGAAVVDQALSDPLWGRTFDFAYEAEVAALARARRPANPAPRRSDGR